MANWTILKAAIADTIKTNGNQEITGAVLQNTLNSIVNAVGENATFAGVATPATNPGTPDGPTFYIASAAGVYSNFGGIEVKFGEICILRYTQGHWAKENISISNYNIIKKLSYPLVLSPDETILEKAYLRADYSIIDGFENYRVRKIPVKSNDKIFISGNVNGNIVVAALFSSEQPSPETLIEKYVHVTGESSIYLDTIASADGYLIVTENTNLNSLLVVINCVFSKQNDLEDVKSNIGLIDPGVTHATSYINTDGNIINNFAGYSVQIYSLKKGDVVSYNIKGQGTYMMVGIFTSTELGSANLKENLGNAIQKISSTRKNDYSCEEDEYIAFTVKDGEYFKVYKNSEFAKYSINQQIEDVKNDLEDVKNDLEDVKNDLEDVKSNINVYSSIENSYLNNKGDQLNVTAGFSNYRVDLYDVSKFTGTEIVIAGGIRGMIRIYGFTNSEQINSNTTISYGDSWSDNTKVTTYNKTVKIPENAKYLCLTVYKDDSNQLTASLVSVNQKIEDVKNDLEDVKNDLEDVKSNIGYSNNIAWELKNSVDKALSSQYPTHNIPLLGRLNNRYDFEGIKIQESFLVPAIGEKVIIKVSDNPNVYINYSSTEPLLKNGDEICIGTKTLYDIYKITNIDSLSLTCELKKCNTGLIGETLNASTDFPDNSSKNATNYIGVFKKSDIQSYESLELPRSVSFDGIHPNANGYSLCSKIIADVISNVYGIPIKIYAFGDSWTHDSSGWSEVGTILGCTMVNNGVQGDRIEHIMKRFVAFMEDYSPSEKDVFLFVMGTNNLLGLSRDNQDKNKQLYNYSYPSIFLDACELISSKLPKGNWFVANGHSTSSTLR